MCGIAGILGPAARVPTDLVEAMAATLRHRGPDGQGVWRDDRSIALAHRRLAVLDLSRAGAQPMVSRDGRWVLSFNGEIYNHPAIRRELEFSSAYEWRGHSDTEVLLEAIARWGLKSALARCNGMFALAVWDRQDKALTLVRDRMGEKPLYFGWVGGDILFASELKALRCHPRWQHAIEPGALGWMLQVGYVPAPMSIHPGIYKLPAGSLICLTEADVAAPLSIQGFEARLERYWRLEDTIEGARSQGWQGSPQEAQAELERRIDEAVRLRMLADVPVGALLSGGVDSTLVVASMARQSATPIRTFTVGFQESGYDESADAREVAERWGTLHESLELPPSAALDLVGHLPEVYDEPFADAAQLPAILVSRAARSRVTVALTGDGGDELFQGYQRYLDGERIWNGLARLPKRSGTLAAKLAEGTRRFIPPGRFSQMLGRQAARLAASPMAEDYARSLLTFPGASSGLPAYAGAWPAIPDSLSDASLGEKMRFLDQKFSLPEGIYCKLDHASMASALELRVPLLDPDLVAFSWRFPADWHAHGGVGKKMLREIAFKRLPEGVHGRRKKGFDVPIGQWLRGPLKQWAQDLLSADALRGDPYLDASYVQTMFRHHLERRADHAYSLWAILMYRSWALRHG
tara:strand:+ start:2732 stop:4639 length:1908 start_codon:yes stop_codon:yes gene_type:complete